MSMNVSPHERGCELERERDRLSERARERERERECDRHVYARVKDQTIVWYGICLGRNQICIQIFRENSFKIIEESVF